MSWPDKTGSQNLCRSRSAEWMKNVEKFSFKEITALGDIGYRSLKCFSRLESKIYQPCDVEKIEKETDWPGDWIGRTLLGVSLLSVATGRESAFVEQLVDTVENLRNTQGYLGHIEQPQVFDEQQFSGHNWLLRGLLSYYHWKKDEHALSMARDIVQNLYLPAAGFYRKYPMKREDHVYVGGKSGSVTGKVVNHWRTSSDTGCAFMCLDGLVDYYALTKDERVKMLLEEMIEVFCKIDFIGLSMQTHASLSATRGIIKLYHITGNEQYLEFAKRFFDLYLDYGATANYANFNWFCRAEWTEPCAIIDSYILSSDLFCETKDAFYLKAANRIHYNAMDFAQRLNGGFGCDVCVGPQKTILHADTDGNPLCEAYWCCSMRGGEGLSSLTRNLYLMENGTIYIAQYGNSRLETTDLVVKQRTTFPKEGNVVLEIDNTSDNIRKLALYIPDYALMPSVTVKERTCTVSKTGEFYFLPLSYGKQKITLSFGIALHTEPCIGKMTPAGRYGYWHGDLMLGIETQQPVKGDELEIEMLSSGNYRVKGQHDMLTDLRGNIDEEIIHGSMVKSVQIVFE